MLTLDTSGQERWRVASQRESAVERRQRLLIEDIKSNEVTVAPDEGRDITNLIAQLGKPMTSWDVMRKLKKINPNLHFEYAKADPTKIGVYIRTKEKTSAGTYVDALKHICGMEAGIMPEFSVIHKTKKRIANPELLGRQVASREVPWREVDTYLTETRGWRVILVRLLHANLINRLDVEKHFGWIPSHDSKRWHDQTR